MTAAVRVDKFEERRRELADAALRTLAERGYARTSLREIAKESPFSHGVLHYYFRDKVELITYCVRRYKAVCVRRYDEVVEGATTADGLAAGFAEAMAATLVADATMHRLWYDLRSQALFESCFRADVQEIDGTLQAMVWRVVRRWSELSRRAPAVPEDVAYAMFDGLFQQALLRQVAGEPDAPDRLRDGVRRLLDLVAAAPPGRA
ncbi:MAG: TetR/AcrR family transcriptional regulator [Pseudonocardiales bacterium]|jgi:AcrR family transcriptional regulator|nr:TetR/AcrR family transcriptional regulator [Pseudonocardiales bacterium]